MTENPTSNDIWARAEIESPCVRTCIVHPETGLCVGCARTLEEVAQWSRMDAEARRAIMSELPSRAAAPTTRRGGRAGRRTS